MIHHPPSEVFGAAEELSAHSSSAARLEQDGWTDTGYSDSNSLIRIGIGAPDVPHDDLVRPGRGAPGTDTLGLSAPTIG